MMDDGRSPASPEPGRNLNEGRALARPMNRSSFPPGQTNIALVKALMASLAASKGRAAAEAWLGGVGMQVSDLEDETRAVSLEAAHAALAAFVKVESREAIPGVSKQLLAPDCLGGWVRVLRGASAPEQAFARIDSGDSAFSRTTRWEAVVSSQGRWRGRVTILHDPSLEEDGLLRLGRLAILSAVPVLFGWTKVRAHSLGASGTPVPQRDWGRSSPPRGRAAAEDLVQDFEVEWATPMVPFSAGIGAVAGAALGAVPLAMHVGSAPAEVGLATVVALAGATFGAARAREGRRKAEMRAQGLRVNVLERSLFLRDAREREVGSRNEGAVVAGQYKILRRMGAGATGVIYEATRLADHARVAIKLLRAAAAHEAVASDRLRREAEALGLAWHPNVVEVLDHGHLPDGTAYLVMELLDGDSVATRLASKGHFTPEELLPIALQVCDALAAVHAAGVVHRDLKPSNVYLARARDGGAGERVKLLDFGIARVEWEETRITQSGGPVGTPGYMSPEQESGSPEVDGRSDIFALGAMLYECLVGEPPPSLTPSELIGLAKRSSDRLDSGTQRAAQLVPAGWRVIIDKAMAVQPSDRFSDARELAQALRALGEENASLEASS
jgi:tRNA A-37 threonylcarbamoyl transferase component Bud32